MLVSDFLQVDRPFTAVRAEFGASGPEWLADSAIAAYAEGEQLCLRIFSAIGPMTLSKRVWVELNVPDLRPDRVIQRLTWRASGASGLFPAMDAELEFSPMGEALTSVTFQGSYIPPLGAVGRGADRMLLHRLAETSVRALLRRVALRLEGERLPAPGRFAKPQLVSGL
jgi:hypothetical protein